MYFDLVDPLAIKNSLAEAEIDAWAEIVEAQLHNRLVEQPHGDLDRWAAAVNSLDVPEVKQFNLNTGAITVESDLDAVAREQLFEGLKLLHPWRKGPYMLHGTHIDTEWRSDWKWDRLSHEIDDLSGRKVLDVGCGNGYHCWRMCGAGAELVVGIDPTSLFLMQFHTVKCFLSQDPEGKKLASKVHLLPLGIEHVPEKLECFDTVFSMGVLYHRRSPIDHLIELKDTLDRHGQLVLETLVIDGEEGQVLVPHGRYAKMRNVWFIPSVPTLEAWLRRVGFRNVRTVDVSQTSVEEQRSSNDWMRFESLADFLDPADSSRTIEGYPAPKRAIVLAQK